VTTLRTSTTIPDATVARVPLYLRALRGLVESGTDTCSSDDLARLVGTTSSQVRKDLSFLGSQGTRGVGYDVQRLADQMGAMVGNDRDWPMIIVGAGNLGSALATYQGLSRRGLDVIAVVDIAPHLVGTAIGDIPVRHIDELPAVLEGRGPALGVIATPSQAAQDAVDALVNAGVRSILNFAPAAVVAPAGVEVRHVDVASELQILAYHEQQRQAVIDA
jgi:redox-sensing transcriptional repressor